MLDMWAAERIDYLDANRGFFVASYETVETKWWVSSAPSTFVQHKLVQSVVLDRERSQGI